MKYRIGDVSKMLKISDQMIRYYEKCGVIQPERSGDGKYRYYTEMDIFLLFEAMKYKEWNINIGDIGYMVSTDYYDLLIRNLSDFENKLGSEILYKQVLKERIAWVRKRLRLCRYNTENIWVDLMPAHTLYYMGKSQSDQYDVSELNSDMASTIFSSEYISFFDPYAEYENEKGTWWYFIWQDHHDRLGITDHGEYRKVPEQTVLMSVMDMGMPGDFSAARYEHLLKYAREHNYEVTGNVRGIIIGRGNEGNQFRRMMQIMVPIRTL